MKTRFFILFCFLFFLINQSISAQEDLNGQYLNSIEFQTHLLSYEDAKELTGLGPHDIDNQEKINTSIEKITNYYRSNGYQKAKASYIKDKFKLIIQVNPGPKTFIQKITYEGLNKEDSSYLIENIYWNFVGAALTDDKLKQLNLEIRKRINQRGLYLTSIPAPELSYEAEGTAAILKYKLQPKNKYFISIEGSKQFSEYFLKTEVLKLSEYINTDDTFIDDISLQLKKFYLSKGYLQSNISYNILKYQDGFKVVYKINENKKVYINQLRITGVYSRPEKYYINKFYEFSSPAVKAKLFIKEDIDQSIKNLIVFLQNEGFIATKVKKIDLSVDPQHPTKGNIRIQIDEGNQTRISEIVFLNNHAFSKDQLIMALELKSTNLLNLNDLEPALNNLKSFYADNGYLEMQISNHNSSQLVEYKEDYSTARILIDIHEGPQISVGSIAIDGDLRTHHKVIYSELDFKAGDILTPKKLEESTARLQKTGLFANIEIKTKEADTAIEKRSVIVSLTERKPGVLTTGVGITNENSYTLHGYAGVAYRNIGGWGRGLSLRADGNYNPTVVGFLESKVVVGFLEPYLFDTRARFRLNYTTSRAVTDYLIRQKTIANQAVWSVEQDFSSHITGIWQIYNIANYVDEGISREDEIKYGYERNDLVIASVGPILDIDYRDNLLNPTSGHFSRLAIEYASTSLGSHKSDDFIRATGQATMYSSFLASRVVWANSIRGGILHPLDKNSFGVRFDKKGFILGGRSTVRGFESTEFFPSADTLGANYKVIGNSSYELVKSELRFPLLPQSDLAGALFYDGGRVHIEKLAASTSFVSEWRDSVGIGIRYNLPIGPLNLEYAHKLNRKNNESDGAFHLSVGVF